MRSAARAVAWEFQRYGWAPILIGYVLVLGALKLLILGPGQVMTVDPPNGTAALVIVPLSITFFYFIAVFSFGFAGDLGGRQSIYPARMFTLPVTTNALAGWPMLYGTATMVMLWLATVLFVRWSSGPDVPLIWPGLLIAVFLAWTQALMWMPYALPGLRVIFTVLWLVALDAAVFVAIELQVPERVMVAALLPQLPLAYLASRFAVARARRGDEPDWRRMLARLALIADVLPQRRDHFASSAQAQLWFEWRRHGRSLPTWVAILLPFELFLLFVFSETPALIFYTLFAVLLTPPFMAAFAAAAVSKSNPHARDSYGVAPFMATRPLTSAALMAAKLKMAIWSTLVAWLLVLVATPLALTLSGNWPLVIERANQGIELVGMPRAIVIALLAFLGLVASTWKQLVQRLYFGLTGREWLIKSRMFLNLSLLVAIGPILHWLVDNGEIRVAIWNALRWVPGVLIGVKMCAAGWVITRLYDSRLVSDRTLVIGATCWSMLVLALYALLVWLVSTPLTARYFLGLVAILAIPLARLSAAPLALAWNRHR